jgi:hypothetical protein
MKLQQKAISRILPGLFILAMFAVVTVAGTRATAAPESAPLIVAQTQLKQGTKPGDSGRGGPSSMKANTATVKVLCNGNTSTECCKGISFCGCLYAPMPKKGDEDKPLSCNSSPPKN